MRFIPPSPLAFWLVRVPLTAVNITTSTDARENLATNQGGAKKEDVFLSKWHRLIALTLVSSFCRMKGLGVIATPPG